MICYTHYTYVPKTVCEKGQPGARMSLLLKQVYILFSHKVLQIVKSHKSMCLGNFSNKQLSSMKENKKEKN